MVSLHEWGRALGRLRWVELRLFEVLGEWVTAVTEPGVKALLATHSRHHGWHAEIWGERLRDLPGADADDLLVPANDSLVRALDDVAGSEKTDETIERLAGVYGAVLPRLTGAYAELRAAATPASDGPFLRWLDVVLADEVRHETELELVVQSLGR